MKKMSNSPKTIGDNFKNCQTWICDAVLLCTCYYYKQILVYIFRHLPISCQFYVGSKAMIKAKINREIRLNSKLIQIAQIPFPALPFQFTNEAINFHLSTENIIFPQEQSWTAPKTKNQSVNQTIQTGIAIRQPFWTFIGL